MKNIKTLPLILFAFLLIYSSCAYSIKSEKKSSAIKFDKNLTNFKYPYPVKFLTTNAQGQKLKMAYMDIQLKNPSKSIVVLLHGKNFAGFYFEPIIKELLKKGHRVIVPDQVGFGKSTKPVGFQFSFHQLAVLTHEMLNRLNTNKVTLVGHSMGGMLATRYALLYPDEVKKLILVNPIGLEDYKTLTHYKSIDELYKMELASNENRIRDYQKTFYYDGQWNNQYEALIHPALGWLNGPDYPIIARIAAQTTEMLYTQPVVYEFKNLKMKTVLINGDRDKTAPGKPWALPGKAEQMGNYPELGKQVSKIIPQGRLIELKGLGHVPFIEDFNVFAKVFFKEID